MMRDRRAPIGTRLSGLFVVAALAPGIAVAQNASDRSGPTRIESSQVESSQVESRQVGADGDESTAIEQLSPTRTRGNARLSVQRQIAPWAETDRTATSDIDPDRRDDAAAPVSQLSERGDRRSAPQLYRGGRTAQPSMPLSTPSQGRTAAVTRVEGDDACDPARADADARRDAGCARVIETRSAEFAPPTPAPLSPEQRLLVESRARDGDALRRLSSSGTADDMADQAIASVVLDAARAPAPAPTEEPTPEVDPAVAALVEAIARQVTPP